MTRIRIAALACLIALTGTVAWLAITAAGAGYTVNCELAARRLMTAFVELHPAGPLVKTLPGEMDQQVAELATEWQRSEGSAGCLRFLRLTEGWSAERLVNGFGGEQ